MNFEKLANDVASVVLQKIARITSRNNKDLEAMEAVAIGGARDARKGKIDNAFKAKGEMDDISKRVQQRSAGRNIPEKKKSEQFRKSNELTQGLINEVQNIGPQY